ncbi:YIP1 family protein [Seohaeicola nanhaiensis]|uniref:YIP1 family protein n=1 Tax=Seohaeicola nanhaiensis TaxID=1387282 RepID=A0ABV9KE26_9RHOB
MAVTSDISATYRGPGRVIGRLLDDGRQEGRALTFALVAGLLFFVAQSPYQAREAQLDPSGPLAVRLYWSAFFWVLIVPLAAYLLAAVFWVLARLTRRRISGYGIRLALFWALLASTPVALLAGMVAGFIGPGRQLDIVATLWVAVFVWFLVAGLVRAERAAA